MLSIVINFGSQSSFNGLIIVFISIDTYYSLLFQSYTYKFIPNKIHFTFDYATKSFSRKNGDSIILFQDESYFEFALFDAMGHFESSGKYSLFAKRLFEITRE